MKKVIIVLIAALILGVGAWGYLWWHQATSSKVVTLLQPDVPKDVLGSATKIITWQTAYFSSAYPTNFRVLTSDEIGHGNTIGQYLLSSTSIEQSDQLAVTVGDLGGIPLRDLASVKLRLINPGTYQQTTKSYAPLGSIAFTTQDPYQSSIFWQQGDRYAIVVVSGSSARQAVLDQALEAVVINWRWQ